MYERGYAPSLLNPYGLGSLGGGLDPPSAECPQPVHTNDRDALRNRIGEWTGPWDVDHVAEGHPDIKAAWNDIRGRLRGLYDRPLLLRCSKEARDRADRWLGQLQELCNAVKSDGRNCSGYTRVPQAFQFTVYRGPTYTIRASSHPDVSRAQQAFAGNAPPATVAPVSSAPPGSVVIDGQVYASSSAAAAATAPPAQEPTSPDAGGVVSTSGGGGGTNYPPSSGAAGGFSLEGSVAGIPTKYLLYGALALVAFRMVK